MKPKMMCLLASLMLSVGCVQKTPIRVSCPAPLYPPNEVLDTMATYQDGTPSGEWVKRYERQQAVLEEIRDIMKSRQQ
jgi:hypothetical protein